MPSILAQYGDGRPNTCWEWPHARSADGYGQTTRAGRVLYVHRLVFVEVNDREPVGGVVRHACDNPPCFNPRHLREGTQRDNAHDSIRRMRQPRAKLDWAKVAQIRAAYLRGGVSQRQLATQFEVSQRLICRVLNNISWPKEASPK